MTSYILILKTNDNQIQLNVCLESLLLAGNGLKGTIPPELGRLSKLLELTMGDNDLTGTIPSHIGSLTKLKT